MQSSAWNTLFDFETRDLVTRFIKHKHDRKASERQILEITSNFIQGREYFRNAYRSDITVRPLLLYYGVSSLSRGLILACMPHLSESALKPSHGLETSLWQESIAKKDFGSLRVIITRGTFYDLLEATKNESYFRANSSAINWKVGFDMPAVNTELIFSQLVQTIPDLHKEYITWSETPLYFAKLKEFTPINDAEYNYVLAKPNYPEVVDQLFPASIYSTHSIAEVQQTISLLTSQRAVPQFSQSNMDPFKMGIGEVVITKALNQTICLNTLSQIYCLSYFLGMMARYFPSTWIALGRTSKGDSIYPLIIKILDVVATYFPQTVIDYLSNLNVPMAGQAKNG
jgi:hypothetical protein